MSTVDVVCQTEGETGCVGNTLWISLTHTHTYVQEHNTHLHTFVNWGLCVFCPNHPVCLGLDFLQVWVWACMRACIRLSAHSHHATLHHIPLMQVPVCSVLFHVKILFLFQPMRSSSTVRWVYLCGVVILRHRLWAVMCVCSLQTPACSLMSVWLTSSLAQISIKAPADEAAADGCCVLGCLVCLSSSVKYLLIRKMGRPCFPAGWILPCTAFSI